MDWPRFAPAVVLIITAALVASPWRAHVDDVDAQVYEVVARNMVADRTWFDLRYLPDVWPRFREHLPFSFWPAAAAMRALGEWSVNLLYAGFTLASVWLTGRIAARLGGRWAGVTAALALGTCESIWQYGGRFLLEPPLLLAATAAAGVALRAKPRWGAAAAFGALAVLAKGPFGLVPLTSVVLARSMTERTGRLLIFGALSIAAAALPAAVFLVLDRALGNGTWWTGYLEHRLLGWTTGATVEGLALRWFPLRVIAGRFWPGLPLIAYGLWVSRRDRRVRTLALACAIGALLLCIPERKWGNHTYVLFPLLAIFGGAAAGPALDRALAGTRARRAVQSLAIGALVAWLLALTTLGRWVLQPPCIVSREFSAELASLPAGSPIAIVSSEPEWLVVGPLAAERRLVPRLSPSLPDSGGPGVAVAPATTAARPPWVEKASARGWALLRR
jgi:4-amino-4-deoxy-L-arabinose transferase-like glycosyltransferase